MANISGAVQIETGIKHRLSIPVQSVAVEQSIDVGTLLLSCLKQRKRACNEMGGGNFCGHAVCRLAVLHFAGTLPSDPSRRRCDHQSIGRLGSIAAEPEKAVASAPAEHSKE